jgi:hypothetical protein
VILHGGCHCGAVRVEFETRAPETLSVRECQCTFCRKQGARNTSDPEGHTRIVAERGALIRYRFGLRTADFLVCARCGVYLGCSLDDAFVSINTRVLDDADAARLTKPPQPMDFGGEDSGGRVERRRQKWTPATIEERS